MRIILFSLVLKLITASAVLAEPNCVKTSSGVVCTSDTHRDTLIAAGDSRNIFSWPEINNSIGYDVETFNLKTLQVIREYHLSTNQIYFDQPGLYEIRIRAIDAFGEIINTQTVFVDLEQVSRQN